MSFEKRDADTVLRKLTADPKNTHHVVGLVIITSTHRIRLYRSHGKLPSFIEHKWRQQLRLTPEEFAALHKCKLSGDEARALCKKRLGL
jgi:hypothetical protein